jgi:hypothetical protein
MLKTSYYFRSPVISFWELSNIEKSKIESEMDHLTTDELERESFVQNPNDKDEILPLSNFMRLTETRIFSGVYGQTAFSAYYIAVSRCGSEAVIAYQYSV